VISTFFFHLAEKTLSVKTSIAHFVFLSVALLLPSIIAGCRDLTVGCDVLLYMEPGFRLARSCDSFSSFYEKIPSEPLYRLLTYVTASCTENVGWLLFFTQFIITFLVYCSAYKLRRQAPIYFFMIVYFLSSFHLGLNIAKQMLALSFCLLSFVHLLNHQYVKSILVFLPAWGFHNTAFIYLFVYPIFYLANKQKNFALLSFKFAGVIIIIFLICNLDDVLIFSVSNNLLGAKFFAYTSVRTKGQSYFPDTIFVYCIVLLTIVHHVGIKKYDEKSFRLFECILFFCLMLCGIGYVSIFSAVRCMFYFLFLSVVFLPIMVYGKKKIYHSRGLYIFVLSFLLVYWLKTIVWSNYADVFPYSSETLHIT
jgi:hypothetical protein